MIIRCFKLFLMQRATTLFRLFAASADIPTLAARSGHGQPEDRAGTRRSQDLQTGTGSLAYSVQYAGVELDYNLGVIAQW